MKFKPEDFEAAFGITKLDHTDIPDLDWYRICVRATDAANDKLQEFEDAQSNKN